MHRSRLFPWHILCNIIGDENDNEKPEITEDMDSVVTIEALKKAGVLANNNKG